MKLTFLNSLRLVMFILMSYVYYQSVESHTTIQFVYTIIAGAGFCFNHLFMGSQAGKRYYLIPLALDSLFIIGFVFFFPEATLYLILFGVNAVTLFLVAESKRILLGCSLAFFVIWGICITYTFYATGNFSVMNNLINFTFIVFAAVVGRLIHKLLLAQEKIESQYDELAQTHDALKVAHEKLHHYSSQVEELTLIRERNRISGEIHDTVGHKMTALLVQLQVAKELLNSKPEKSKETILLCEELARNTLQEIRLSVRTLREDRQPQSFLSTVRKILEDYKMMTGLTSTLAVKGDATKIPVSIQLDLTRIIQESITNSVRHGQANECSVMLEVTDSNIDIFIKDNGTGAATVSPGFGLKNMRERVHEHGGNIMFESTASNGFIVKARFPLKEIRWQMGGA
ncbi:sensor histidine kinase [Metabacillus litoralis]|uniref:sensor histidine kinase n=1 Tax=Metabacillus litoralis TaxID=152268 RepID=UPI00203F4F03|nr:sensor histidine kinase [Metabacillus litoralis]MCM3164791.1 sensor histidine kinase [Metabacillus litoralis]